ncbi:excinuclease ABC subunit UvrC [Acutalibacter sp. LFL-21]|uniref:excinuclease ABC subunit UvrC n=1 Tax=Acutalibacter sp. LFL-21 TaxID=2983399 RepID=UPI0021D6827C|nr:excinuclease ABC subunit UvrC [Acutalibacter sp. LFL-21]MCU7652947.1 excinuclease ABC subunit UvrC [Acutalibacter sp. LFL-21]
MDPIEKKKELRRKAMKLPLSPGVYLMHDKSGQIIYIGKAKALKNRVSQYFGSEKNHDNKVRRMVSHVDWFEYIVCDSEFEALVLESSLIKQNQPKYNILLKDDKGYSYIRVSPGPWPRMTEVKKVEEDGAKYIGPYMSSWSIKQTIDSARKIFRLPDCSRKFPQDFGKGRPCLNYYIKQCCAPCRGRVSEEEYNEAFQEAMDFIKGGSSASVKVLTERMEQAAENLEFELAARLRDRINAIEMMGARQKVVASRVEEQDVFALAQGETHTAFEVFRFTGNRLSDRESFLTEGCQPDPEARSEFLRQYYAIRDRVPPLVVLDGEVEDEELLVRWLSEKRGKTVRLLVPQRGDQAQLVQMCRKNAAESIARQTGGSGRDASALDELRRLLGLEKAPAYIESYDISNLAGGENVAGMVVFENGRPLKSAYRKFKIKTVEGQDDYGSMREVIRRRFQEYYACQEKGEAEGFGRLPDLILLDGGKGHVAAVQPLLEEMGIEVPLFGMVKDDRHRTRAIAQGGGEIAISSYRRAYTLVSSIQDEVHRFAIGYHRQQRKKSAISSTLTSIPGIGEARAKALLKHFKTVTAVSEADLAELEGAPGMTKPAARRVWEHFHPEAAGLEEGL